VHTDLIRISLGLPGLAVLDVHDGTPIQVLARFRDEEATCPGCGRRTWQVHEWHRQVKRDLTACGRQVEILLLKRRFRCRRCRKVFTEPDPLCGLRRRSTRRWRQLLGCRARWSTVRAVAREEQVSEGLVQRSWVELHTPPPAPHQAPRFLGIDGFCVSRPHKMWSGFWDLEERAPVAVVPGERQRDVQAVLDGLARPERVEAVVIDLAEAYRQAVRMALPETAVVADKFHVIALAGRALRQGRRERRQPGNVAWLMDRAVERLGPGERARLGRALAEQPELANGWVLKEELRALYRCGSQATAARHLDHWVLAARQSSLPSFRRVAGTLEKWRDETLNYWRFPLTNAFVEGKHNRVKVAKRQAYGYRNDEVFRLRILNLIHTY
jgi:transposase